MGWQQEDRQLLLAAADEFRDYLHSSTIQWKTNFTQVFTAGRVLLAQKRVLFLKDDHPVNEKLNKIIDRVKLENKAIWQRKIESEIPYRLNIWKNMLHDYMDEGLDSSYTSQVSNRVMLALLMNEVDILHPSIELTLSELDDKLRTLAGEGDFIWDPVLAPVFPTVDYWYLYTNMKGG
jgi:hypothetical protein